MAQPNPHDLHDEVLIQAERLSVTYGKLSAPMALAGHPLRTISIDWNVTGDILASSADDGTVHLWSAQDLARIAESGFGRHGSALNQVVWSPTEHYCLGSTSADQGVLLWDHRDGGASPVVSFGRPKPLIEPLWFDFSADGQRVAVAELNRHSSRISIYDTRTGKPLDQFIDIPAVITSLSWVHSTDILVAGTSSGRIYISSGKVDSPSAAGSPSLPIHAHTASVLSVKSEGPIFVSGASDSMLQIWDSKDMACIASFAHADNSVRAASISADAQVIAAAYEKDIAIYSNHGRLVTCIHTGVWAVAWHPWRHLIAYGGEGLSKNHTTGKYPGTLAITSFDA